MTRRAAFLLSLWLGAGLSSALLASCSDDDFGQERPASDASAAVNEDAAASDGSTADLVGVSTADLIIPASTDMAVSGDLSPAADLLPGG